MKNVIGWEVKTQEYGSGHNFTVPWDAHGELLGGFLGSLAQLHTPKEQYNGELYDISFEVKPIYSTNDSELDFDDLKDLLDDPVIEDLPIEDVEEAVAEDVAKEVE